MKKVSHKESKFNLAQIEPSLIRLVRRTDKKTLALWAISCTRRVLPYFNKKFPKDARPQMAIEALQKWRRTGVFKMEEIRKASLDSHAAARDVGEDSSARSAARAAGQAVATAHVKTHSIGASVYALQAIYRAKVSQGSDAAVAKERKWQYNLLLKLRARLEGSKL